MATNTAILETIKYYAHQFGFADFGITAVEPMNPAPLRQWLDAGYGAGMSYLERHLSQRANLPSLIPGANSILCFALPYQGPEPGKSAMPSVACYAQGLDYHTVISQALHHLWEKVRELCPTALARIFVDSGKLPERELARRAGLGWIGKNSCLIHPGFGSRLLLGEIITDLQLSPSAPVSGSCGNCRRCLDACPTGALAAPGIVDARRCISYLTIENRESIPLHLRPLIGNRLFGCDTCQDVCPLNNGVGQGASPLSPCPEITAPDLTAILSLTEEEFYHQFNNTALKRVQRGGLLRNACIVLGNQGNTAAIPALRHALLDTDPLVRVHAAWALDQLGNIQFISNKRGREGEAPAWP